MSDILLETHGLTKAYNKRNVVDGVDIHVRKGSIYGLIGRNGAGKTTLMKMISGMISTTDGTFEYRGIAGGNKAAYSKIGTLIEIPAIMPKLTARENLKLKCLAYGQDDEKFISAGRSCQDGQGQGRQVFTWYEAASGNSPGHGRQP